MQLVPLLWDLEHHPARAAACPGVVATAITLVVIAIKAVAKINLRITDSFHVPILLPFGFDILFPKSRKVNYGLVRSDVRTTSN
jgi:hypothetical protein